MVFLVWIVLDLTHARTMLASLPWRALADPLAALVFAAAALSLALCLAWLALSGAGRLLHRTSGGRGGFLVWVGALLPAAPFIAGWWLLAADLGSRPRVAALEHSGLLVAGAQVLGAVCLWVLFRLQAAWMEAALRGRSHPRLRFLLVFVCGFLVVGGALADAFVQPGRYASFHAGLTALFLLGAAWLGGLLAGRIRTLPAIALLLLLVVPGGLGIRRLWRGRLPGPDPLERSLVLVRAPISSRLLLPLQRRARALPATTDAVLEALTRPIRTPATWLDRRLPDRSRFNVVLISIDTLRADRVGASRAGRALTPHLDAFARECVVFETAYAQHSSSQLSMASMFKGLYPTATDVLARMDRGSRVKGPFSDPPLALRLKEAGYETEAVTAFDERLLGSFFTYLPDGFDRFNAYPHERLLTAEEVRRQASEALRSKGARPFFLWVHFFDPHNPYHPHEEFSFGDHPVQLYDGEVAYADAHLGRFLDELRAREDWKRTVVIIHSDHGEEFREHGGLFHHSSVYEEQVRVPFLIRIPGVPAARIEEPVELVDLPETLYDLLGLDPLPRSHGQSLLPLIMDPDGTVLPDLRPAPAAFAQFHGPHLRISRLDGMRMGRFKIIHNLTADTLHLFDLAADPGERHDLAIEDPLAVERLRPWLGGFQRLARGGEVSRAETPLEGLPDGEITRRARSASLEERAEMLKRLTRAGRADAVLAVAGLLLDPEVPPGTLIHAVRVVGHQASKEALPALERLLVHPRRDVRDEVALALSSFDEEGVLDLLRQQQSEGLVSWRAAVARGLLDDPQVDASLAVLGGKLRGDDLELLCIARARRRHEGFPGLLAQAVASRSLGFSNDLLAIRAGGRLAIFEILQAFHERLSTGATSSLYADHFLSALRHFPVDESAPVLGRLLLHPDEGVRARTEALLRERGRPAWVETLRRIQEMLGGVRQLGDVTVASGRAQAVFREAFALAAKAGLHDWSIALGYWDWHLRRRRGDLAARVLATVAADAKDAPENYRAFLRKLAHLGRTARLEPRVTLDFLAGAGRAPGNGVFVGVARVSVAPGFGPLLGGNQGGASRLHASLVDAGGVRRVLPSTDLPRPGLLDGEERLMLLRYSLKEAAAGPAEVRLRCVGEGLQKVACPELSVGVEVTAP